jgi:hypothetical protein
MINSMVVVVSFSKGIYQGNGRVAGAKPAATAVMDDTIRTRETKIASFFGVACLRNISKWLRGYPVPLKSK